MSDRSSILAWAGQGAVTDAQAALKAAGVLPMARDWRMFLDRLLLWSGAVTLAAAAVFFIAHNWNDLGRFAKFGMVEVLIISAVLGYWRFGVERAAGKSSLLAASILLGALLALFGQTYQTGADTWELFANWAALILPWVLIGRFAGLWMLWVAIVNVAIVLYFQVFPGLFGVVFSTEHQLWTLFVFNTATLLCWELAGKRITWLNERWAPRLLVIASGATVTMLMLQTIFDWHETSAAALLAYPVWIAGAYGAYRILTRELFVLAGGCLSLIIVATSFLARTILDSRAEAGGLLLIAITVIAMGAAAGWWLKQIAREEQS